MSSGAAKLLFLLFSLVYLLSDSLATSDDEVVVNLKPIDLSQLILQKKNYIAPRAENPTTISTPTTTQTPSFAVCGVANGNGKIFGGNETEPNEFPWQAVLKVDWIGKDNTTANASSYCGGSLIADRWILTSASCLVAPSHQGQELIRVNVYLGGHNISAASEINRKEFWGNKTVIHPDWNSTTQSGNVALVNLSTVVKYSKFIRPICLASTTEPDYVKQIVTLIGVGLTQLSDNSSLSLIPNKMTTSVVSNSQCNSTYINLMTDRMMCTAGVANNSGICDVDKGDPLMFKQMDGTFKQIGIVSFAPTADSTCQTSGTPLAYTRLSSYSNWIVNITNITPSTHPPPTPPTTTQSPSSSATTNGMSILLELFTILIFAIMALY